MKISLRLKLITFSWAASRVNCLKVCRRFGDHLCPHHQDIMSTSDSEDRDGDITETQVIFNQLTWLIAEGIFIS
jgi:hypothetical protein